MGRKKNNLKRHFHSRRERQRYRIYNPAPTREEPPQQEASRISLRRQEFLDLVETAGFNIPWQLNNWERFFLNEDTYLDAAEKWLSEKLMGVAWPVITDDVDLKLKKLPPYNPQGNSWSSGWQQSEYGSVWQNNWRANALPLKPLLSAPFGLSATPQHCM